MLDIALILIAVLVSLAISSLTGIVVPPRIKQARIEQALQDVVDMQPEAAKKKLVDLGQAPKLVWCSPGSTCPMTKEYGWDVLLRVDPKTGRVYHAKQFFQD